MRAPAGEAWSVESYPEWVTVTPSSGVGKVDVTITVSEMSAGDVGTFQTGTVNSSGKVTYTTHAGRGGEVVFLLNDKDYRVSTTIEQYDYTYGDGDLITLQEKGVGNGVNIVLMGDCFDAKDISEGKYLKAMQDAYSYFFDIEPYITYKDYFNVYALFGMSADSGMGTVNTIREARFGSQYTLNEGVSPDFETVFAGACVAPINDNVSNTLVILVENSYEYSGLCYMWGDGSAVAVVPMSNDPAPYDFRGLVHHEAGGHGFGKLADEYIYHNAFIQSCSCPCCGHVKNINAMKSYGFYTNISLIGSMQEVPWSHMIYDPQYSNVVDVYEGAYMHTRGVWRSEATSCMNNNIAYYNAISREAMVKRIMKYAGEEYIGSLPKDATVHLHSTVTDARISLANGSVVKNPYSGAKSIKMRNLGIRTFEDGEAVVYEAIVVPQMLETSVPLLEINSKSVSYLLEDMFNFKPGVSYTYTAILNTSTTAIKIDIGCEIEDWNNIGGGSEAAATLSAVFARSNI